VNETDVIVRSILEHYPTAQAIYLFGTYGTADEWPDSDVDIAVLFLPQQAKKAGLLAMSDLRFELEALLKKEVDLYICVVFPLFSKKEVIAADRRVYCADEYAADEFEMLMLSYYQKLNEERAEIIEDAFPMGPNMTAKGCIANRTSRNVL
jgi:predicted nucleotidyltransferase